MSGPRRCSRALLVALTCGALAACQASGDTRPTNTPTSTPTPTPTSITAARLAVSTLRPVTPPAVAEARELLALLPLVPRRTPTSAGYLRAAFGNSWVDTDRNGCNQRDDVLVRDGVPGTVWVREQGRCDHDVVAGTWVDPYTGRVITSSDLKNLREAQRVQIDHVVPLAEAWVSGADEWGNGRRRRFANDLAELQATDGPTNASKGSSDPAAWRPKKSYQCVYARRWIAVKFSYRLGVDASEQRALNEMLAYCE